MANRFIGGVLSSRPQANTPFSSRASTGTYFNSAGTLVTAPVNQPRLNYSLVGSTWTQPTVLIEPASTNIITYSEQINNAAWSKIAEGSRTGVTANAATAPDGNTTADLVYVFNGITSVSGGAYWPYTFTNGITYTWSCFFKYVGYQYVYMGTDNNNASCVWFDLSAGTVGSASTGFRGTITNVGNGWYRCATTFTFASASMGNAGPIMGCANVNGSVTLTQAGTGSTGVYMWGAQLEVNSLGATSYIPTVASTVTRAADVVGPYSTGIFNLSDRQNTTAIDDQSTVTSFTTTGSTSWTAPLDVTSVEVLVVAGGGSGGRGYGGGGGAGGLVYNNAYPVTPGVTYPIVIGAGGASQPTGGVDIKGNNGSNSQFGAIVAIGGGGGAAESDGFNGRAGGSGGGAGYSGTSGGGAGVAGQGNRGGNGIGAGGHYPNAGGGGAGTAGFSPVAVTAGTYAGTGGAGLGFNISGTLTYYAGGGGGGAGYDNGGGYGGLGGIGGGGGGAGDGTAGGSTSVGVAGTANTGGGGGGGNGSNYASGAGGSGVVVIKYKRTPRQISSTSNAAIVTQKFSTTNLWTVPAGVTQVEALVVAGGGGGGYGRDVTNTGSYGAGGGGAGGLVYSSALTVTPGSTYAIGVGTGGLGAQGTTGAANQGYSGFGSGIGTGTELITNGSAFTVTTGWTATTATLSVPQTGTFRITPNVSVNGTASQSITTVNGTTYVAVVKVTSDVAKFFRLRIGTTQVGAEITDFFTAWTNTSLDNGTTGSGFYSTTFTATGSTTWINMQVGGGTQQATDISYISVRQATLPAFGGGAGGGVSNSSTYQSGLSGGSGGGAGSWSTANGTPGSAVSGQGNAGGTGVTSGASAGEAGGGGGGAGSAGLNAIFAKAGNGGTGLPYNITGNLEYYAGGGGGGSDLSATLVGQGGLGGGGGGNANGLVGGNAAGANGAPNTGGGGGGAGASSAGGSGGSGVVILRYRVPQVAIFQDSGSWTCPAGVTSVQALIVAGGGGGGPPGGGGGGAGGLLYNSNIPVTPGITYPIVVGQGGDGGVYNTRPGNTGGNSSFVNLIAVGGGAGGGNSILPQSGGSGGGQSGNQTASTSLGTYGQGNAGGTGTNSPTYQTNGGGGGAGGAGGNGNGSTVCGAGGAGLTYSISGSSVTYAGGGGGSGGSGGSVAGAAGGGGGGGLGGTGSSNNPTPGLINTGGGGGGRGNGVDPGAHGGSGIVILRWVGA